MRLNRQLIYKHLKWLYLLTNIGNCMYGIVALVKPSSIPLREVVRTFKGATTYCIRAEDMPDFAWQRNYYEHVIRNDEDLDRIRQYVVNNPVSWAEDRYFTEA